MTTSQIYILLAIVVLAVIAVVVRFIRKKPPRPLGPLTALGLILVVMAIVFSQRWISYSLIGAGVLLAIVDMFLSSKKNN